MASESSDAVTDLSPQPTVGEFFSSSLESKAKDIQKDDEQQRFTEDVLSLPLTGLRTLFSNEEDGSVLKDVYREAYRYRTEEIISELNGLSGWEEYSRRVGELKAKGEIDDSDIEALMPIAIEQGRKPLPNLIDRETLKAAALAAPKSVEDLVVGASGLLAYAPVAIEELNRVMKSRNIPGTPVKPGDPISEVWRRWQEMKASVGGTPALSTIEAAAIQGTSEGTRLAQRLGRTLFSDVSDYSDKALADRLRADVKFYEFITAVESGDAFPDLGPEDIKYIQSMGEILDFTGYGPFGIGFKSAKEASRIAAALKVGAKKTGKEVAVSATRKALGDVVETIGKRGKALSDKAVKNPVLAGGITLAVTGDVSTAAVAALTASSKEGSRLVGRIIGTPSKIIESTGRAIKKPLRGPAAEAANLLKEYGVASIYGSAAMVPFAITAESPEEAGTLIGGGIGASALGVTTAKGTSGVAKFGQNMWAPSSPAGPNAPRSVVTSYGTEFDNDHESFAEKLSTDELNRVEALRDLIGPNNRLYVLSPEAYDATGSLKGTSGIANFTDSQGINTTIVRGGTESLLHEVGHVITNSLTETQKNELYETARRAYGQDGLQQMRDHYESLGVKLRDETALLDEVLAENFQVALNGGPLSNFGTPRDFAAKIYSFFGETVESLGARDLSMGQNVVTSDTLQFTPSFIVQKAIRNVMDAINLDDAAPIDLKTANGTVTRVPRKQPTEVDVGVATKVPIDLINQSDIPVAGSISGIETTPRQQTKRREAPTTPAPAPTTQRPNVRVTRGQQESFVPPTPEQQAANNERLQDLASRPRTEQAYVETEYFAAKPITGTEPDAPRRLAQRQLADRAEVDYPNYSNPLRSAFQKIFAPYKNLGGNKIIGFSFDKLIQNLDILAGWAGEQITAGNEVQLPYDLSSPDLRRDIQSYLKNHSNGYAGDGRKLSRPEDTVEGTIPPENPNYTPVSIDPTKAQFINLLMGLEPPKKTTAAAAYNRRFAEQNGLVIAETPTGSPEVNILRAQLRESGFDSSLLNGVLEVLRTDRVVGDIVERNDINLGVGEGAFIRAGFMPSDPKTAVEAERPSRSLSPTVRSVADDYLARAGIDSIPHGENTPINEGLAKRIADYYEQVEDTPNDPEVNAAYQSLSDQTMDQYAAMEAAGMRVEPWVQDGQPYKNSAEMVADVRDNNHLYIFLTENGYGTDSPINQNNPLLQSAGVTINGKKLVVNDIFRAVHDYFGHAMNGYEFGPRGELNAYVEHSRMFTPSAVRALAAETLAQNSWVNFGPHLRKEDGSLPRKNEGGYIPPTDRPYAPQKNFIVPQEFIDEVDSFVTPTEGRNDLGDRGTVGLEDDAATVFGDVSLPTEPEPQYMPLLDETVAPKDIQYQTTKKKGSLGRPQRLVHFASTNMKVLDPKKSSGKGAATPVDLRGLPRGYFYRMKKSAYESGISDRANIYTATVDGNAIYNLNTDLLGYNLIPNRVKADQMLVDAGFSGMRGNNGTIDMVAMFKAVRVEPATVEDVYTAKQLKAQRAPRKPLSDVGSPLKPLAPLEDIDYTARDAEWEQKQNSFMPPEGKIKWDRQEGLGNFPYQKDIKYFGFQKLMLPSEFRSLVPSGVSGKGTTAHVLEQVKQGKPIAPPYLEARWDEEKSAWEVTGHEGRSRTDAAAILEPTRPVAVSIKVSPGRARNLTSEQMNAPLITQGKPNSSPKQVGELYTPEADNNRYMPSASKAQESEFAKSTVRDADGKLKPLFHYTSADFKRFGKGDLGYHFGTTEQAEKRSTDPTPFSQIENGGRTIPVFLNIEKPLRSKDVGPWNDPEQVLFGLPRKMMRELPEAILKEVDKYVAWTVQYVGLMKDFESARESRAQAALASIREGLKGLGYDGVVYKNEFESATTEEDSYIAFDNDQIMPAFTDDVSARFMPSSKAGEMGSTVELTEDMVNPYSFMPVARVNLEDYIGQDVVTITTDRLATGKVGDSRPLAREAQGGRGFPLTHDGLGWAFSTEAAASRFLARIKVAEGGLTALVATAVLGEANVLNSPFGQYAVAMAYRNAVDMGQLNERTVNRTIKQIFQRASEAAGSDVNLAKIKTLAEYEKATEAWPFSFGATSHVANRLDAATLPISTEARTNLKLDKLAIARSISDKELAGLPNFSLVSLMEIDKSQTPKKTDVHFSYPWTVKGKLVGFFNTPYLADTLLTASKLRNQRGELSAQPVMLGMPSIGALKSSEINPNPEAVLRNAKITQRPRVFN